MASRGGLLLALGLFAYLAFEYFWQALLLRQLLPEVGGMLLVAGFIRSLWSWPGALLGGGLLLWLWGRKAAGARTGQAR